MWRKSQLSGCLDFGGYGGGGGDVSLCYIIIGSDVSDGAGDGVVTSPGNPYTSGVSCGGVSGTGSSGLGGDVSVVRNGSSCGGVIVRGGGARDQQFILGRSSKAREGGEGGELPGT